MLTTFRRANIDWSDCPFVERIPGKLSGVAVIEHSRVRPDDLVANLDEGPEWLAENYALPLETVRTVPSFNDRKKGRVALRAA